MASSSSPGARGWASRFAAPLPVSFYDRPVLRVARALLGQRLIRRAPGGWQVGRIVETEAYARGDPASHAYRGPTPRNRSMFAGPGTLYVFRIHQVHCANAVTRPGEAVLLRAVQPVAGPWVRPIGPGRLCRELGVGPDLDGADLTRGPLRIIPGGPVDAVVRGPRVGIHVAMERPWRFAEKDSRWVSRPRPGPAAGRRPT